MYFLSAYNTCINLSEKANSCCFHEFVKNVFVRLTQNFKDLFLISRGKCSLPKQCGSLGFGRAKKRKREKLLKKEKKSGKEKARVQK